MQEHEKHDLNRRLSANERDRITTLPWVVRWIVKGRWMLLALAFLLGILVGGILGGIVAVLTLALAIWGFVEANVLRRTQI